MVGSRGMWKLIVKSSLLCVCKIDRKKSIYVCNKEHNKFDQDCSSSYKMLLIKLKFLIELEEIIDDAVCVFTVR